MNKKAIALTTIAIVLGALAFFLNSRQLPQNPSSQSASSEPKQTAYPKPPGGESRASIGDLRASGVEMPQTADETAPTVTAKADYDQVAKAGKDGDHAPVWREKFIERLEPILQDRLRNEGFSQNDIDLMTKELLGEIRKPGDTIKISDAVNHTAEALSLDREKKNKLNMAVLNSYAQSVEVSYEQWNQCLSYRIKTMPKCVQDIAQDLSRNVASVTAGELFTSEERPKREEIGKKAQAEAIQQCGLSPEAAENALTFVLSGCP